MRVIAGCPECLQENKIIHSGRIPTSKEAIKYGTLIYNEVIDVVNKLQTKFNQQMQKNQLDLNAYRAKAYKSQNLTSFMLCHSVMFSLSQPG